MQDAPVSWSTGGDSDEEHPPWCLEPVLQLYPEEQTSMQGFVGHDFRHKAKSSFRAMSFQGQSRLAAADPTLAAQKLGQYLVKLGVDVAIICETGVRDSTEQLADFSTELRQSYAMLVVNHYP